MSGIPPGSIPQLETIVRNGTSFSVRTRITYVDDPFDDLTPIDLLATDYKQVRVEVAPSGLATPGRTATFITNISPLGIETTAGGGTLSILVFDSVGVPISSAEVVIRKDDVAPFVDITTYTASDGRVILPGAPISTAEVSTPSKPYLSVLEGQLASQSFSIDLLSNLVVNSHGSRDLGFPAQANVSFQIHGNKIIGSDTDGNPVYKYDQGLTTDGFGGLNIPNLEWDNYTISLGLNPSLDLTGSSPFVPVVLPPGQTLPVAFGTDSASAHSLLVKVADSGSVPIEAATVRLTNGVLSYDETLPSGASGAPDFGQAFFPLLSEDTYTLEVIQVGFQTSTVPVIISGDTVEQVFLNPE